MTSDTSIKRFLPVPIFRFKSNSNLWGFTMAFLCLRQRCRTLSFFRPKASAVSANAVLRSLPSLFNLWDRNMQIWYRVSSGVSVFKSMGTLEWWLANTDTMMMRWHEEILKVVTSCEQWCWRFVILSLVLLKLWVVIDGLWVVFDGAGPKYLAGSSRSPGHSMSFEPFWGFFRPDDAETSVENQVSLESSWRELSSHVRTKF